MNLAVYLPLVIPLLAAIMARQLADRLPPRTATWLLTGGATVLAAAAAAAVRAAWQRTGALVAAHRQASWLPGAGQVVVVTDDAADAHTPPGWPGRIVVTTAAAPLPALPGIRAAARATGR